MSVATFEDLTRRRPPRGLVRALRPSGGRNQQGRLTARHRGGGHRRLYRTIDFKRDKDDMAARVLSLEYDPNRSARIARLRYEDGEQRYIIAPLGVGVGDTVMSGLAVDIRPGNALPLGSIPTGTFVHCVELIPGKGAQMARSAGTSAQVMAKEGGLVVLRLPSGEMRRVRPECRATVGRTGNVDHENVKLGKAGRTRWRGRRPTVRGVVQNPVDHPHGGGEGKSPIGMPGPVTPWGKPTLGYRTRKRRKASDKFIVKRRK